VGSEQCDSLLIGFLQPKLEFEGTDIVIHHGNYFDRSHPVVFRVIQ